MPQGEIDKEIAGQICPAISFFAEDVSLVFLGLKSFANPCRDSNSGKDELLNAQLLTMQPY